MPDNHDFTMFIPLLKVDVKRREVWGIGADESLDQAGEIFDYEASKPFISDWSAKVQKASGGKSKGNVRGQHGNVAAGRVIDLRFDDAGKRVILGVNVVDDNEWEKVEKGVYTGFSIGGYYAKRWNDAAGRKRYAGAPLEWSLVDVPNNHNATFELIKADGARVETSADELRKSTAILDLQKEGTMAENPDVSTGSIAAEDEQEELHEHDILKAKLAAMVDKKLLESAVADAIWAAIMADEAAELKEEQGETAEAEAAEGGAVQKAAGWEPRKETGKQENTEARQPENGKTEKPEEAEPDEQDEGTATLDTNNDVSTSSTQRTGDNPGEIAGKQNVKATPAPAGGAPEAGQTGNAPVAAVAPAKPSMTPEATRALILEVLVQLGLAEKVGGAASGQTPVYQAIKPQMQKAAMVPDHTGEIEALQKAIGARETVEIELRSDLAKAIAAIENMEKRGAVGIVVRELGADDARLAKSQQVGVLTDMLQKAVDPGVRQALQAEITALEIRNVRAQKS